ncbi:MAG: enoyl-CoA hydratase/isomerase family protein [Acidimicrobiia bacterium]
MAYTPTPHVVIERDGPVAIITLNNPEMRNAFLDDMDEALRDVWWHLAEDDSVRAVVLTGAGTAFSAGGDIPSFIKSYEDADYRRKSLRGAKRLMDAQIEFPKPVVAAVNGAAVGLGCNVALGCDVVFMAEGAFFADTHVSIGLVCGDGGAVFWPALMGLLRCKEYLLTGDRIPASKALELGLANRVVSEDELMQEALAFATRLAQQPRQAIQETKRALNLHLQDMINRVAPFALSAESESFATDDIKRTIEGFKRKEAPA